MNWLSALLDWITPPCEGQPDEIEQRQQRFDAERKRAFDKAEAKARMYGDNHDGHEL